MNNCCPICNYTFSRCQCLVAGNAHPDRWRRAMVANIATYENVDLTAETIEDAFDHVIDKLIELGGDNNAEN